MKSAFEIDVQFTHFPLHPDTPSDGLTLEQLFAGRSIDLAAAQSRMTHLMAEEGLAYGQRSMTYNSRLAQELAVWAESQAGGDAIHDALFAAYFVDGINLADVENLMQIAMKLGLDVDQARKSLRARMMSDRVDADWRRSRELGVSGVPTFVVGQRGVAGAQPYEVLEKLLIDAGARRRQNGKWRDE